MSDKALPEFYKHWIQTPSPEDGESFDCKACFMLKPKGYTRDLGPFKQELKCCTFHPFLPAFTLGRLLLAEIESGLKSECSSQALEMYFRSSRLSPLGAFPRKPGSSVCETGRHMKAACAFLSKDGNALCTIRDFRPSTCAGYVCRSKSGAAGLRQWRDWESKIKEFEWTLAHLAAFELGFTLDDVDQEFPDVSGARQYFVRAYEVALALRFSDVTG